MCYTWYGRRFARVWFVSRTRILRRIRGFSERAFLLLDPVLAAPALLSPVSLALLPGAEGLVVVAPRVRVRAERIAGLALSSTSRGDIRLALRALARALLSPGALRVHGRRARALQTRVGGVVQVLIRHVVAREVAATTLTPTPARVAALLLDAEHRRRALHAVRPERLVIDLRLGPGRRSRSVRLLLSVALVTVAGDVTERVHPLGHLRGHPIPPPTVAEARPKVPRMNATREGILLTKHDEQDEFALYRELSSFSGARPLGQHGNEARAENASSAR